MANVQTYFNKFHNTIQRSYDEGSILRKKRDMLLEDIRDELRRHSQDAGSRIPRFDDFNQGSYAMGTGIAPLPGEDYDIDVGLVFHIPKEDHSPVEVKQWVHDALQSGNRTVEYKRPCVRVQYHRAGEPSYHVDLAIYSGSNSHWGNQIYLAKGFLGSTPENQVWELSDPKRLIETFQQKFQHQEEDRNQFRRVIRFLKRWKDFKFRADGNGRPTGIAITACAMNWFQVGTIYNPDTGRWDYNDLTALKNLTQAIIDRFTWSGRISVKLPVPPSNDLFEKMGDRQMGDFKSRLEMLRDALTQVELTVEPLTACHLLRDVFGDDFPTP